MNKLAVLGALVVAGVITYATMPETRKEVPPKVEHASAPAPATSPAKSEPISAESAAEQKECVRKVEQAQTGGIIRKITGLNVIVDETTWRRIPYDTKLGMAHTICCAAVGPGKYIPLTFRSDRTNKVLGEFSGVRLDVL